MRLEQIARRAGTLQSLLRSQLGLSCGLIQRLKRQNALLVNGRARHTNERVAAGDQITVLLDEHPSGYPPEERELSLLYEDEAVLALDKPPGVLVHPSSSRNTGTLANFLLAYYRKTGQACGVHPLTRLDRDTFGVVLFAKNAFVQDVLMQKGELKKIYRARVFGAPEKETGEICAPIARCPYPSLLREIRPDGQKALTRYCVLERGESCSLLSLEPVTGRTHQLRLHCQSAGFPILGDPQYATPASAALSQKMGLTSQALCAAALSWSDPITGERRAVSSRQSV